MTSHPQEHSPAAPATHTSGWWGRIEQRIRFHALLKGVGTATFMLLFFNAYFALLEIPQKAPITVPEIWLDKWIHFTPAAFPVYLSLWVYVSLPQALIGNLRAIIWFGVWIGALCLVGLGVFWFWPTQTPAFNIDWSQFPVLSKLKGIDASGNAFPSLHVATAVFSACWLHRILRQLACPTWAYLANWLHCLAIAWSTMATLQHVALDVFSGAALGLVFAAASLAHIRNTGPAAVSRAAA